MPEINKIVAEPKDLKSTDIGTSGSSVIINWRTPMARPKTNFRKKPVKSVNRCRLVRWEKEDNSNGVFSVFGPFNNKLMDKAINKSTSRLCSYRLFSNPRR